MKNFFKKILNILNWIPVLWWDRNDDFSSIDMILYHKLKNMYNYSKNNRNNFTKLKWALDLFDKLLNDSYYKEREKYFQYKTIFSFGKNNKHFLDNFKNLIQRDNLKEYVEKNKSYWNKHLKEYHTQDFGELDSKDKIHIANKIYVIKEKRARELAYKIIKDYHTYWWD